MTRKKSGIDWTKTSCCGAAKVRVAGIWRCSSCQREVAHYPHEGTGHMYDAHDREYSDEINWKTRTTKSED